VTGRRLVVTVCPRERGSVVLPVEAGGRPLRMDAATLTRHLDVLIGRRDLGDRVRIREACAGGCAAPGPNVDVAIHAVPRPGAPGDNVAVGRRTYVYTLPALDCLARVIDDNLDR
jgi:hypothetical protein